MMLPVTVLFLGAVSLIHYGTCFSVPLQERSFTPSDAGQKRGIYGPFGLTKVPSESGPSVYAAKPSSSSNPMNPFLSLRPFLPAKPTFFPPMVDPNIFINKKAQMLDSLFSSSAINNIAPGAGVTNNESPMPQASAVNPQGFISTKTEFLNSLFNQLTSNDEPSSVAQRDLFGANDDAPSIERRIVSGPSPLWGPILSPTEKMKLFTDKKTQFLDKLFTSISVTPQPETDNADAVGELGTTVKPTIVPPDFWVPQYKKPGTMQRRAMPASVQQSFIPEPPLSWNPLISPMAKAYSDKKTDFLNKLFASVLSSPAAPPEMGSAFDTISPTVKPTIVPPSFWLPAYKTSTPTAENDIAVNSPPSSVIKESDAVLPFPFAPLVNGAPVISPTYFINKKNEFLAKLFQSLNTTNPSATEYSGSDVDTAAYPYFIAQLFNYLNDSNSGEESAYSSPKRHSPDSENIRVSDLEKLLRLSSDIYDSEGSTATNLFSERSVTVAEPVSPYASTKDMFVNNILAELANIKNSMLQAATEVVQQQKSLSTPPGSDTSGKKSGTTYGSPYKMWGKAAAVMPTSDPLQPFVSKMTYLSHLFDTLTQLEKNMTSAIEQQAALGAQKNTETEPTLNSRALNSGDTSSNLAALQLCGTNGELPLTELSSLANEPATADALTNDNLLNKSKKLFCHLLASAQKGNGIPSTGPIARSIKMAVHQGYQSLPPGTEELLQAGGGGGSGESQSQEGGGLKLQNIGLDNGQEQWSSQRHHNHHH